MKNCTTCAHCERRSRDKGYCHIAQMVIDLNVRRDCTEHKKRKDPKNG